CSNRIEKVLNKTDGITVATVNLATESADIAYTPGVINEAEIIQRIQKLGYDATEKQSPADKEEQKEEEYEAKKRKLVISIFLSLPLLYTMFAHLPIQVNVPVPSFLMNPWVQLVLATPVQFFIGWSFYVGAYKALRNKSAN